MKVVVVGAGVIGASIAWNLTKAGCDVTVIDGQQATASNCSFGWINASFYADHAHHLLRRAGMEAYERLTAALPDLAVQNCGTLWWEEQGAELAAMQADLQSLEYPVDRLANADVMAMEPDVQGVPEEALRFPSESAAEAGVLARQILQATRARVVAGAKVTGVKVFGGAVRGVDTDIGVIQADRVVIAAGIGAPDILQSVGVALPMLTRPGALVTTKPVAAQITSILVTPHGEVRQLPDGRILASAVAGHQGDASDAITETPDEIATRVLGWLNPMIKGAPLEWDQVSVAMRPLPFDGLPVIGEAGPAGLNVAVMHSGVTLAAITGEIVADEILGIADHADLLTPYRPQRFQ